MQRTGVVGCLAQFLMKLELQDETDKISAGKRITSSSPHHHIYTVTFYHKYKKKNIMRQNVKEDLKEVESH